jgi:hypothetical protein
MMVGRTSNQCVCLHCAPAHLSDYCSPRESATTGPSCNTPPPVQRGEPSDRVHLATASVRRMNEGPFTMPTSTEEMQWVRGDSDLYKEFCYIFLWIFEVNKCTWSCIRLCLSLTEHTGEDGGLKYAKYTGIKDSGTQRHRTWHSGRRGAAPIPYTQFGAPPTI